MKKRSALALLLSSLVLVGCGGGGGETPSSPESLEPMSASSGDSSAKDSNVTPKSDPSIDSGSLTSDSSEESSGEAIPTLDKLEFVLSEDEAFYSVKAKGTDILGEVVIPEEIDGIPVAVIDDEAFENCDKVTSIVIPNTVEEIGDEAFKGCASLTKVFLPSSLAYLGDDVFDECASMTDIDVDEDNVVFASKDGVLFNKLGMTLVRCPCGKKGRYAVGAGVSVIGERAFRNCALLTEVELPSTLLSIEDGAFGHCLSLTKVFLPASLLQIGQNPFLGCLSLFHIEVDANSRNFRSEDGVLFDDAMETLLVYPAGKGGAYVVPLGVKEIGDYAFIGGAITSITLAETTTSIGEHAFSSCVNLSTVHLPDGLKSIDFCAFSECLSLTYIYIPKGVTFLDLYAFVGCVNLASIGVDNDNENYASSGGAVYDKAMTKILLCPEGKQGRYEIPQGVDSIQYFAFRGCAKLYTIAFPKSLVNIGIGAFTDCVNLSEFDVDAYNPKFYAQDCVLFNKERFSLVRCPLGRTGAYTCPLNVEKIESDAFSQCALLTSITLSNGVEDIYSSAFDGCSLLSSIRLPVSLKYMSNYLFTGCDALTTIRYDGTVEQWEENVTKEEYWHKGARTTVVECKDGHAPIE